MSDCNVNKILIVFFIFIQQEVISANTNAKERSGNLINLGQINAKLSAIPDWEFMFNGSARAGPSS